jgi:putative membrane protein
MSDGAPGAPEPPEPVRPRSVIRRLFDTRLHEGHEPDPRFTFANERTFLAWSRTALALIGGGLVVAQVLHFGLGGAHLLVAIPAIILGGLISIVAYLRWERNERSMRLGEPLAYSPIVRILSFGIVLIAMTSGVLVLIAALKK